MEIRLDPQGEPHWLSELRAKPRHVLRVIVGQGRQLRLRLKYHPWLNRLRDERESRAFIRKHGGVAKVEDMPRQPVRPRRPRPRPKK